MSGKGTPAIDAARHAGIYHVVHEYTHDAASTGRERRPSWGLEAADALGVEPGRVLKTLLAKVDETRFVFGVVPVDRRDGQPDRPPGVTRPMDPRPRCGSPRHDAAV